MLFDRLFLECSSGVRAHKKRTSEQRVSKTFNVKALKHVNNVLLWLRISAVSRENYSTAELTVMWMYVALNSWYGGTRTVTERMFTVAQYYDISPKADRGDISIVHDQKSSYHAPLVWHSHSPSFSCSKLKVTSTNKLSCFNDNYLVILWFI